MPGRRAVAGRQYLGIRLLETRSAARFRKQVVRGAVAGGSYGAWWFGAEAGVVAAGDARLRIGSEEWRAQEWEAGRDRPARGFG